MAATSVLQIVLKAKDEASKTIGGISTQLNKVGLSTEKLAKGAKIAGVGITAFGAALGGTAIKAAMDFETAMSDVNTLFDDNGEAVDTMSRGIKDLLKTTPKSAADLGASAYAIVSAGISDASEALQVLDASQKLAVAGLGETTEATDIVTSAINAFGMEASDAGQISDVFFKAVKSGKTTVSELAQGFGQVAPLAKNMGVKFEDLLSVTSAMTTSGMKASIAYSQIRAALSNLAKPTKDMQDIYSKLNLTVEDVTKSISEKGMTGTIRMLTDAADGNQEVLAKMFGSVEGLNAVMMLMNETGDNAGDIFNSMTEAGNALDSAFEKQTKTTKAQYEILKNNLNVAMMNLGNQILPVLLPLVKKLSDFIGKLNPDILKWAFGLSMIIGPSLIILGFLPGIIKGVQMLGIAIGLLGKAFLWLATNPIVFIIAGIVALGVGIYMLIKYWDKVKKKTLEVWSKISAFMDTTLGKIVTILLGPIGGVLLIIKHWEKLKEATFKIWDAIRDKIESIVNGIETVLGKIKDIFMSAFEIDWGTIGRKLIDGAAGIYMALFDYTISTWAEWGIIIGESFGNMIKITLEKLVEWETAIVSFFTSMPGKIKNWFNAWTAAFGQWMIDVYNIMTEGFIKWNENLYNWFSELPSRVIGWLGNTWEAIRDWFMGLFETTEATMATNKATSDMIQRLIEGLDNNKLTLIGKWALIIAGVILSLPVLLAAAIVTFVIDIFLKMTTAIISKAEDIKKALTDVFKNAFTSVKENIGTWMGEIMDQITGWISNITSKISSSIKGAASGAVGIIKNVIPLASGGIVTRPTLAMVGESGPEAVIPLSKMGGVGGGIVVNINGGTYLSEEVAESIGDKIIERLKSNIRI